MPARKETVKRESTFKVIENVVLLPSRSHDNNTTSSIALYVKEKRKEKKPEEFSPEEEAAEKSEEREKASDELWEIWNSCRDEQVPFSHPPTPICKSLRKRNVTMSRHKFSQLKASKGIFSSKGLREVFLHFSVG
jgi:hypothetical protein